MASVSFQLAEPLFVHKLDHDFEGVIVLFMAISAIVELIFMHIPEETVRKKLSGKGLWPGWQ